MTSSKIILLMVSSFGEITWLASGTEYVYSIPGIWIDRIARLARYAPGRAFNLTKKHGKLIMKGGRYVNQREDHAKNQIA